MIGAIERVIRAFNEAEVRYLVVGGVATVLHGYLRTTADLDLVVWLEPANALRAVRALEALGYRPRAPVPVHAFASAEQRAQWVRDKGLTVLSWWSNADPTLEVDLFVEEPFDFESAWAGSLAVQLDSTTAQVVGLDWLVRLKLAAGRPRDLADVEALRSIAAQNAGRQDHER